MVVTCNLCLFALLKGVGFGSFSDDEVDQLYTNQTNKKPVEVCAALLSKGLHNTSFHLFLSSLFAPSDLLVLLQELVCCTHVYNQQNITSFQVTLISVRVCHHVVQSSTSRLLFSLTTSSLEALCLCSMLLLQPLQPRSLPQPMLCPSLLPHLHHFLQVLNPPQSSMFMQRSLSLSSKICL